MKMWLWGGAGSGATARDRKSRVSGRLDRFVGEVAQEKGRTQPNYRVDANYQLISESADAERPAPRPADDARTPAARARRRLPR